MGHRRINVLGAAALVFSTLAIAAPGVAGADGDGLAITPDSAAAGMSVTVSGSGFDGHCDVLLRWAMSDGPVIGSAPVDEAGSFTAEVQIPEEAAAGRTSIEAHGRLHGLPGEGCGADSGVIATGRVNVSAAASAKGREIALLARTIRSPGIDQATIARARGGSAPIHAIVQLHSLPRAGDLDTLAALGITPLSYLNATDGSGSAYLASISPSVQSNDGRFGQLVRGVHPILSQDKIEYTLAARNAADQQSIDAMILFFPDVSADTALDVLGVVGVSAVVDHGSGLYQAILRRADVQRLALVDAVQFISEAPEPGQLDLDVSRALVNADVVQQFLGSGLYAGMTGLGVQVSVHDSGVDPTHRDFEGRMIRTLVPGGSDHGTHVASIAVGSGLMSDQDDDGGNPNGGTAFQWRGLAPQAGLSAFGSQTAHNAGTMQAAIVDDGVDVSNHSYSYNDAQYNDQMVSIDGLIRGDNANVPARPQVFSAGNQGGQPQFGQNSGYFSLSKSCKNCIIVANMAGSNTLRQSSSHGPTPDGRVKPELGALGTGVIAAGANIDNNGNAVDGNSYRGMGGTSMATPAVTGVIALLLQQYGAQFGVNIDTSPPLPSTMKAILIQTAVDQVGTSDGTNPDTGAATVFGPGPDWATGWGLVDAGAASQLLASERFLEDSVSVANHTDTHYVQVVPGQDELKVTLAWDDLPGTPNADHSTPQLVNDLDLYLVGPNGELALPLVLPPATQFDCDAGTDGVQTGCANPGADPGPWPSATTAINAAPGIDRLNNVEQVVLADPAPGLWRVMVSVMNLDTTVRLPLGGSQAYSLAGVNEARADLSVAKTTSPDPIVFAGNELIYTVTVANAGPDTAEGVVVADTLPPEVVYVADDAGCTYSPPAHELICELGDVAAGASVSFLIKTVVKPDTVVSTGGHKNITNTVLVSSETPDLNAANNTTAKITFVQESADLSVTKLCEPNDHQQAGQSATCRIFVDNFGPSYARSVVLTDTLSSDGAFTISSVTTSAGACATASNVITCNLGNLANASPTTSGRVTVTVVITATEDVDVDNLSSVVAATPDPDMSNNQATEGVQFVAVADLALTKSGPAAAIAGTEIQYSLSVTNNGPSTAPGVVVQDLLPAEVTMVSVVCSGGGTANPGQPGNPLAPATCSFGTLAPGANRTMIVTVTIKPDVLGVVHNNARASSGVLDPDLSDNLATVDTTVTGSADLSITKSDSPDPVLAGNPLSYTITATNGGPSTAFDVQITDTLPAGTTFVSGENGNGDTVCTLVEPGVVVCDIGTLAPGASATVFLKVEVSPSLDPDAELVNTATVTSSTPDPDEVNNTATATTTVHTAADVWLDKQAELRSGNPSNLVIYTLVVHNDGGCETDAQSTPTPTCGEGGPSDARDVVVVDQLPLDSKKFVVQYLSPQCSYDASAHEVTCTADVVPVGASVTFVIEGQISGSVGTIINTASVTASTPDPNPSNNTNAATIVHQGGTGGKGGGGGGKGGGNGGGKK